MVKLQYVARGHDITDTSTVEELAMALQKNGLQGIQLALNISFPEFASAEKLNTGMGNYIRNVFSERNITVAILSCYINMIHPDLEKRENLLQRFEQYVQYASSFGAHIVATETGCVLEEIQYAEANFTDEAFHEMLKVIQRLVSVAERFGIIVGIEPGLNHPLYSLEKVVDMLEYIPSKHLGIILDPTNLISVQSYPQQVELVQRAFELFGERIVAVHLKDFEVKENTLLPVDMGRGKMKYTELVRIIQRYKPYLYVVLEETKDAALKEGIRLLDQS